ncbi:MAG: ABC transporter substrate-binding protein [Synergistaceae bacterium]|jgi:peptide/nickel transport system substrate-binding protein|nr:ABC transporter substrate-binding protein [Synergistaceae bacterium]
MMRKNALGILLVVMSVFFLTAAASAAEKKILRYGAVPMKSTLDMELNTYNMVMDISDHITETLVRYDDDMNIVPVLVKELPKPSADGKTYRFELKPGIKFHDGTTLKASDVKFTFERMFTPSTGALMTSLYTMIEGAPEMLDGKATTLKGFKVINDNVFEITLSSPYSPFLACLSASYASIYPEKACKAAGKDWGLTTFIGTGPFKAEKIDFDNAVSTVRFDDYHGTKAKLDGIEFVFIEDPNTRRMEYERGNIDVMWLDATIYPEYSKNAKFAPEIREFTPMGTIYVNLNFKFVDDVKVREAVSLAIDRGVLTRDLMKSTAKEATTFIPPGMMGHDPSAPKYEFNVEKAKALLAEAGYPDGLELEGIVRNTNATGTLGRTLLSVQNMLAAAGIDLKVTQVDPATWTDMRNAGKVPLSIGNWYADFADPDGLITLMESSISRTLSANYNSPEYDGLLAEGRLITDAAKREEIYKKADHLATRVDYATMPLFHETMYYLTKPYVKNFKMTPTYVFHFFGADIVK